MNVASRTILLTALLAPAAVTQETLRCESTVEFRSLTGLIPVPPEMFAVNEILRETQ